MDSLEMNVGKKFTMDKYYSQVKVVVPNNIKEVVSVLTRSDIVSNDIINNFLVLNGKIYVDVIYISEENVIENASSVIDFVERQKVDIRTHRIIYEIIEEIEAAMKGMLAPTFKEVINGHAEVRQTIRVPGVGTIAGCYIQDGKITRNSQIRILRDGVVIFEDKIASLKRFKDDAKEVAAGYECGVGLEKFNDIKEGDILEAFVMEEVQR